MKRTITRIIFVLSCACLLLFCPLFRGRLQAQNRSLEQLRPRTCSNESLEGAYGFSFNGTTGLGLVAAVGKISFDGDGNVSGSYSESLGGVIIKGNFVGAYVVHSDCTVSATLMGAKAPSSWSAQAEGVIVDDGRELFLVGTDPGTVVNGELKKLSRRRAD
jgi:hypothetical protein